MHPDRVRFLKKGPLGDGPVIYLTVSYLITPYLHQGLC